MESSVTVILVLLGVLVGGYFVAKRKKSKDSSEQSGGNVNPTPPSDRPTEIRDIDPRNDHTHLR